MRSFEQLADMTGRGALVVGGAGHLGRVACAALREVGAEVVCADVPSARPPPDVEALEVDLHDEADTRALVPSTLERLGRLDVLVHCAAYTGANSTSGWATDFEQQSVEAWDRAHRVNVTSAFVLAQTARMPLAAASRGSIVFLSSIYGFLAPDFRLYAGTEMHSPAGYSASKAGLLQLMRYLSTRLAPDIRVNAVSPGGVARGQDRAFVERYEHGTPLARMATEEDVKGAIVYLASDLSAYVTGTNLVIDGGRAAW